MAIRDNKNLRHLDKKLKLGDWEGFLGLLNSYLVEMQELRSIIVEISKSAHLKKAEVYGAKAYLTTALSTEKNTSGSAKFARDIKLNTNKVLQILDGSDGTNGLINSIQKKGMN